MSTPENKITLENGGFLSPLPDDVRSHAVTEREEQAAKDRDKKDKKNQKARDGRQEKKSEKQRQEEAQDFKDLANAANEAAQAVREQAAQTQRLIENMNQASEKEKDPDAKNVTQEAIETMRDYIRGQAESQAAQMAFQRRYYEENQADLPPELKPQTKERVASVLGIREGEKPTNEQVVLHVSDWFETRLRHLESFDQTFEELSWVYSPLLVTTSYYEHDPELKHFGDELRRKLEARRVRQRMVLVWKMGDPGAIHSESARVTLPHLRELFTYKTPARLDANGNVVREGGRPLIEEEFRNYEHMGEQLKALNARGDDASKQQAGDLKKAILNYYRHGGTTFDEGGNEVLVDERIKQMESMGADPNEIEDLREQLWARRFTGGLWSMTLRAASYDIELNGSGDFFASRLLNFTDRLKKSGLSQKTKGMWDPTEGKFAGKPFDLEYRDFFSELFSRITVKESEVGPNAKRDPLSRKDSANVNILRKFGINVGKDDMKPSLDEDKSKDKLVLYRIPSLAGANLGSEELWDSLESKYGTVPNAYNLHMYGFNVTDATRKALLGSDAFFHSPSLKGLLGFKGAFDQVSDSPSVVDLGGKRVKIGRQRKWQEMIERAMEWGVTKEGKEILEQWGVFPDAQKLNWIQTADDEEMITRDQRNYLLRTYLGTRLPSVPIKLQSPLKRAFPFVRLPIGRRESDPYTGARMRAGSSLFTGIFRYAPFRGSMGSGIISEFFKKGLGFIFGD